MLVVAAFTLAMIWAAWRKPDLISAILAASLVFSFYLWDAVTRSDLPVALALTETAMALAMALLCFKALDQNNSRWKEQAERAQAIALIGCLKIIAWLIYTGNGSSIAWNTVATFVNAGLAMQILVAGGFHDTIASKVIGVVDRLRPVFLRHVGGWQGSRKKAEG